jgi:hypothetical protein
VFFPGVGQFVQRRFIIGTLFTLCFAACLCGAVVQLGIFLFVLATRSPLLSPAGTTAPAPPFIPFLAWAAGAATIWTINVTDAFVVGFVRARRSGIRDVRNDESESIIQEPST